MSTHAARADYAFSKQPVTHATPRPGNSNPGRVGPPRSALRSAVQSPARGASNTEKTEVRAWAAHACGANGFGGF